MEKLKTCNRGDQHPKEAQGLKRGDQHPRETQYLPQRGSAP